MLTALMGPCLLLLFIFLLCSLVCVFLLFSQQLLKPRRWWGGQLAGSLFWFWFFRGLQGRKQWQKQYYSLCSLCLVRALSRVSTSVFFSRRSWLFLPLSLFRSSSVSWVFSLFLLAFSLIFLCFYGFFFSGFSSPFQSNSPPFCSSAVLDIYRQENALAPPRVIVQPLG